VASQTPEAVLAGVAEAETLVSTQLPPEIAADIMATFNRLPADAIEAMTAALLEDSSLQRITLAAYPAEETARIGESLLTTLARGKSPRVAAREIANAMGMSLTRALTISRTEIIRARRASALASYRANPHIVKGWIWMSALSQRTCMSCLALHGTRHSLDEDLDDHPNGECTPLPITVSWKDLGIEGIPEIERPQEGDGQRWFEALPEAQQRKQMGNAKWDAWKAGEFEFKQLSKESWDQDWGRMFSEASLKQLRGE